MQMTRYNGNRLKNRYNKAEMATTLVKLLTMAANGFLHILFFRSVCLNNMRGYSIC